MYVCCKGGHGRSGMVMAGIIGKKYNLSAEEALAFVQSGWSAQRDFAFIRQSIAKLGCPQNTKQKDAVKDYLKD